MLIIKLIIDCSHVLFIYLYNNIEIIFICIQILFILFIYYFAYDFYWGAFKDRIISPQPPSPNERNELAFIQTKNIVALRIIL